MRSGGLDSDGIVIKHRDVRGRSNVTCIDEYALRVMEKLGSPL
jgi:hypothetical protein